MDENKWQIKEKHTYVKYKVYQPGKRKLEHVYHGNLIKPSKDQPSLSMELALTIADWPVPEGKIAKELSDVQKKEARQLVLQNKDFFSEQPGQTMMIKDGIITEQDVKVNGKPFRIPEAQREAISKEIKNMVELRVIELHNEWSSPIVLVPKSDSTIGFCNDFRKLNAVSKFVAYPMPQVDELFERPVSWPIIVRQESYPYD